MKRLLSLVVLLGAISPCLVAECPCEKPDPVKEAVEQIEELVKAQTETRCPGDESCACDEVPAKEVAE